MMIKVNPLTKKSQVTMFILVGLVLLIVFGMVFYIFNLQSQESQQSSVQKVTTDILKSENIRNYVTSCVDDALIEGLVLTGMQGGYTNDVFIASSIPLGDFSVPHLITPKSLSFAPVYPCDSSDNPPFYCQFLNDINKFPSLPGYRFGRDRLPSLVGRDFSVQAQLESFIADYTADCTNFSELVQIPGLTSYNISAATPSARVVFSDNDVFVVVDYPVIVMPFGQKPIKTLLRFSSKSFVRYKLLHEAIEELLSKDNRDLDFDLLVNTTNGFVGDTELRFNRLGPNVTIQQSISGLSTVYLITDESSRLRGQPFKFQFARSNRPPVLDMIPEQVINITSGTYTHSFNVFSFDPDEDPLSFSSLSSDAVVRDIIPYRSGWQGTVDLFVSHDHLGNRSITLRSIDGGSFDEQEIPFWVCDSVRHVGDSNTCIFKCGASFQCNDRSSGYHFSSCSVNPFVFDSCNGSCFFTEGNVCAAVDGCSAHPDCGNLPAFSVSQDFWCAGDFGCVRCDQPIVSKFPTPVLPIDDDFACGCLGFTGSPCDPDYDLIFNGVCNVAGDCVVS